MNYWRIIVIFVVCLFSFVILMGFNKKFFEAVTTEWPSFFINFLLVVITVVSAYLIFHFETDRVFRNERQTFKRHFNALIFETSKNIAAINSFLQLLEAQNNGEIKQFNLSRLTLEVSESLLKDPLLYKYTGKEMLTALQSYLTQGKITNSLLSIYMEQFIKNGSLATNAKVDLIGKLQSTKRYALILQIVNQYYIFGYALKMGPSTPVQTDVHNWLNSTDKPNIIELEKTLQETSDKTEKEREKLQNELSKINFDD